MAELPGDQFERLFEATILLEGEHRRAFLEALPSSLREALLALLHASEEGVSRETSDRPPPQEAPTRIGPYRVLRKIGEGGMGGHRASDSPV